MYHLLVVLGIGLKALLGHKVILYALLFMTLSGSCGICDGEQNTENKREFGFIMTFIH